MEPTNQASRAVVLMRTRRKHGQRAQTARIIAHAGGRRVHIQYRHLSGISDQQISPQGSEVVAADPLSPSVSGPTTQADGLAAG